MKYKCPNKKTCCKCHKEGHEWEGEQSSKYYVKCPMCKQDFRTSDYSEFDKTYGLEESKI